MGFMLASLAGGLASGFAAKEKEEEKLGEVFGEYAFKTLYKNYETTKKEREERENIYSDLAIKLREYSSNYGYAPSEFEIKESISSPTFVSEFSRAMQRPDFDPSKVEWQKLFSKIDKSKASDFTGTAQDFIKGEFKMPTAQEVAAGVLPQQEQKSGLFAGVRKKSYETTFQSAAKAAGVSPEQLKGAAGIGSKSTITGSTSQFEFGAFRPEDLDDIGKRLSREKYNLTANIDPENPPPNQKELVDRVDQKLSRWREAKQSINPNADSYTTMKSDAIAGLAHAKQTGDKTKINVALANLNNIMEAEYIAGTMYGGTESHDKAMSRLEATAVKISNMPKGAERDKLEEMNDAEMKTRANFFKRMRSAQGLSEGEKERQVGLATIAAMTRRNIFQEMLPTGAISPLPDGSFAINSLPGVKDEQIKAAALATQKRLIEMLTKDGVPVDNASRLILMANSINFDGSGRAVVNRDLGSPPVSPTAAPTAAPQQAAKPTPQAAPAAASTKPGVDIAAERKAADQAIAKGAPPDKVKALFKQTTGQDY